MTTINQTVSGGQTNGDILPSATGQNLGSLTQLWNAFIQICSFGGATSGATQLQASAVASGVLTLPAATDTLVGKATTDTLTNKTLTSPVITGATLSATGATLVAPVITGAATAAQLSINGGTPITAQSGTGGTVAMTASPTFTGTTTVAALTVTVGPLATIRIGYPRQAVALVNGANSDIALNGASFIKIAGPTGSFSISGFVGGEDGRVLEVFNGTAFAMTITNNATSSAGNRISTLTGADVVLAARTSFATFIYDTGSTFWILKSTN